MTRLPSACIASLNPPCGALLGSGPRAQLSSADLPAEADASQRIPGRGLFEQAGPTPEPRQDPRGNTPEGYAYAGFRTSVPTGGVPDGTGWPTPPPPPPT